MRLCSCSNPKEGTIIVVLGERIVNWWSVAIGITWMLLSRRRNLHISFSEWPVANSALSLPGIYALCIVQVLIKLWLLKHNSVSSYSRTEDNITATQVRTKFDFLLNFWWFGLLYVQLRKQVPPAWHHQKYLKKGYQEFQAPIHGHSMEDGVESSGSQAILSKQCPDYGYVRFSYFASVWISGSNQSSEILLIR